MSILSPSAPPKKQIDFINKTVDKGVLRRLLSKIYEDYGGAKTGQLANILKDLGFKYATSAGVTISIEDLDVPDAKKDLLASAEADIHQSTERFLKGEITEVERYTKVIDTWSETTERLTQLVIDNFNRMNPVYMMAFSGARGNISQVRQLVGMRGLMADSQGQIIDMPIKSNFREGLSVTEYIISSYGARKGLVDTALKTADSGYLTRRLVDVAQDVIISEADCGTTRGILIKPIIEGDKVVVSLEDRLISRTVAENVVNEDGEVLIEAGEVVTQGVADAINAAGIKEVTIRSSLTCETHFGICQKCYGWSLTNNKIVDIGESIGIMAAQSIGEPGTQLTMRTFHTGGAFSGSISWESIVAKADGEVTKAVATRDLRTRHGNEVQVVTKEGTLETEENGKKVKYNLPFGTILHRYEKGAKYKKGDVIAEFEPGGSRESRHLTEKATKDINSDLGGEVYFDGFDTDEKRDRQGNVSRTSNRGGTVWVMAGDVYNLPAGSKHLVKDGQAVKENEILAETLISSEHGGEVRVPADLETEKLKIGKETVQKITEGKDLTIIIASITPDNATRVQTKKEQLWATKGKNAENYIIKSPEGTSVENGSIVAELVDEDESIMLPSSGEIRFKDVEIDDQRILTKPGILYFIPEEIHQVSKDISLKIPDIVSGQFYEAGTEVIKGLETRIDGIVEIVEENDIIREVLVRPGEKHRVDDITTLTVEDGTVVEKGTVVAPGIKTKDRCMITINFQIDEPEDEDEDLEDTSELEYADVLLRPVQEFEVTPRTVKIKFDSTDENISIVPVTQLQFKDGDKVRQIEGATLLRTSLVLQMKGHLSRIKGLVELQGDSDTTDPHKIVVLENLTIRRDAPADGSAGQAASQTQLLVKDGETIKPKTPVVKTQVLAKCVGTISLGNAQDEKEVRRVIIIHDDHTEEVSVSGATKVKEGEFVKLQEKLSASTDAPVSGKVIEVSKKGVTLRRGRPYLISGGAQLHVENRSLAQRGDLIATLVFERQKTGDIVQGLPRVEELLEGRKPKEACVIAPLAGAIEIVMDEETPKVFLTSENGREELSIPVGGNVIVEDQQEVDAGQPITDGAINPHDLLLTNGIEAVRKYLVDEVQRVYRSQGVEIADKHIETIVRQMTKKVRIDEGGDSKYLVGELVDAKFVEAENQKLQEQGSEALVEGHPLLLGITKASLNTDSFISAASFQETTRVLTEAAVEGKRDFLRGLKENVIIGRLIPAGTGCPVFKDERHDMQEEQSISSRSSARKPSAILEEIESMFGSPDISQGTSANMEDVLLDDGSAAPAKTKAKKSKKSDDEELVE
ncbi:MAG: DNA-directed RNA polymerase subunit beta'' [Vampirovibrio sp.]|nr:DNA-directed RNA polymerase subunit beta'' [Vampirovibrio sp.]